MQVMTEFPWDSAIIATVISLSISIVILLIREKKIEPEKWKKNAQLSTLEKQLETYGTLLNFLHSTNEKAKRQNLSDTRKEKHLLEIPYDADKFRQIFSDKRYLLSDKIVAEYLKVEKEDQYFALSRKPKENQTSLLCNLTDMQKYVEEGYSNLRTKFKDLTGYELG